MDDGGGWAVDVREELEGFLDELAGSRYRGLVVLHGELPRLALEAGELLAGRGGCVYVAPRELPVPPGCRPLGPGSVERLLGSEADYVLIATPGLLRPNLLAASAGVPRAGGALVVATPPLGEWSPGPAGGAGGWKRYLLASIGEARTVFWADAWSRVRLRRGPPGRAPEWRLRTGGRRGRGLLGRLEALAATPGQAEALRRLASGLRGGARSLLVTGDRGRGKSFLLGLLAAYAAATGLMGEALVVAPSLEAVQSFFHGLLAGLGAAGRRHRMRRRRGLVSAVTGPWGRVAYAPPDEAMPTGVLVVDEAAAVGVARLRRLAWKSGRVLAATTLHGYEGGGRVLAHLVEKLLPRPMVSVELVEPIRYPPGDPLEDWAMRVFVLRPDAPASPAGGGCVNERREAGPGLAEDTALLRGAVALLALAHYRTEPDYLLTLLESWSHMLFLRRCGGGLVAVADAALEEPWMEEPSRLGLKTLTEQSGVTLSRTVRVVRIAVHPELQRRGHGSALLRAVEEWARGLGADAVAALFGRHGSAGFWAKNSYKLVYVSPRFNKATGEKNLGFAKPLTARGMEAVEKASARTRRKLVYGAHSVYRDLEAEEAATTLIPATSPPGPDALPTNPEALLSMQPDRLEQEIDEAYLAAAAGLLAGCETELTESEATLVYARLLQGKPLGTAAEAASIDPEHAGEALAAALAKLIRCLHHKSHGGR